jgi:glucose/arabinose dehydrogenase
MPRFLSVLFPAIALSLGLQFTLASAEPLLDPIPEPIEFGSQEIKLTVIADGMVAPLHATFAPGDTSRVFVAEQLGTVLAIDLATGIKTVFLDVSDRVVVRPGSYDERGLLGLVFHPDYQTNGLLYTYTSEAVDGDADFPWEIGFSFEPHQSVINEWRVDNPLNPAEVVVPGSRREIMRIDEPTAFHNGGALVFDMQGYMLIALGNGGPLTTGQDNSIILGSILRIVPNAAYAPIGNHQISGNGQYLVPETNPFVSDLDAIDEIFAHGFRNPFRITVDRDTNDIYAGDVGNNDIEEVDLVTAGNNYGFPIKEGSFCFVGAGGPPDGSPGVEDPSTCADISVGLIDPLAEYDHDEGVAVIGGYVYRGTAIKKRLGGIYIFGDFNGRLFYLDGTTIRELSLLEQESLGGALLGMGEDMNGELYLLVNDTGRSSGTSGRLIRIDPLASDIEENQSGPGSQRARKMRARRDERKRIMAEYRANRKPGQEGKKGGGKAAKKPWFRFWK